MSRKDLQNHPTPPDMRTFVEMTARSVAIYGLDEKSVMNCETHQPSLNFNFLKSSEDPLHGYYKQKLAEYLSLKQEDPTNPKLIVSPGDTDTLAITMMASHISKKGLEDEREIIDSFTKLRGAFGFLKSSHCHHAFFRMKLAEFRSLNQHNKDDDDAVADEKVLVKPRDQFILLPDNLHVRLPKGMKRKQFETMMLTAQFAAWYGNRFWLDLTKKAGFEFTDQNDSYFPRFFRLVVEFSKVFTPPEDLEDKMRCDAYAAAIQDGFFRLLQWDGIQELEWREGGVMSMVDWHASLEKDFANKEYDEPEEPKPKRQKFDELATTLVPEDQFLARHAGSSTIRVSVSGVIDITMQSLSENVKSLKEKIAAEIRADRLKLSGKAGLIEDNNKSLAHYNVGAGENLTLSL